MQSYCAVRQTCALTDFCHTPSCFLCAKCLTSLTTVILRPAPGGENTPCLYPGSPAEGWSGKGQAGALAHLELTSMRTFPGHGLLVFWPYPALIYIIKNMN